VREGRDFFGSHVNYAARVASAAEAEAVVVSSLLRDMLAPYREFTFTALPKRELKGFDGEHQLYVASSGRP
jgi:class 3 adenylate cyclase